MNGSRETTAAVVYGPPPDLDGIPRGAIHLQGLGRCNAIPARHLKPGMLISWNYTPIGYVCVSFDQVSPKFGILIERNLTTGDVSKRRLGLDRWVSVSYARTATVEGGAA